MTTATFVTLTCPACRLTSTVTVDALLVSVAVDDRSDAGLPAGPDAAAGSETAGTIAWTCEGCADLATAALDWPALLTVVTAGASLLDDATHEALPPHPEHPSAGAPLTRDDLLTLHELLASDTWFERVSTAGCANPGDVA